jgi:hypothetical protein
MSQPQQEQQEQQQEQFVGELEVDQELDYQQREWKAQRVGWAVMLLIILATLLGLFGRGPLSRASIGGDPLKLEYERFTRHASPTQLTVHLAPGVAGKDGKARVRLRRDYMQGVRIEHITPEPESVEASEDALEYVFEVADPSHPVTAVFQLEADKMWSRSGHIALGDGQPLRFTQFVFP